MSKTANATPSAPLALSASVAASPCACGPLWLVFYVMACSLFGGLLGRLTSVSRAQSLNPFDESPDSPDGHSFAIALRLIAIDWFRRFRSAPSTPAELLLRSPVAQAIMNQPFAPIQPCDLPGEALPAGVFAPAFANQLASAPSAPLALTPSSFLNPFFATLSTSARPALSAGNLSLFNDDACNEAVPPDTAATLSMVHSAFQGRRPSGSSGPHSAFEYAAFPCAPV